MVASKVVTAAALVNVQSRGHCGQPAQGNPLPAANPFHSSICSRPHLPAANSDRSLVRPLLTVVDRVFPFLKHTICLLCSAGTCSNARIAASTTADVTHSARSTAAAWARGTRAR